MKEFDLGKWLRIKMKNTGLTMQEVSEGTKLSERIVHNIISGKKSVPCTVLINLAEFFNMKVKELCDEIGYGIPRQ